MRADLRMDFVSHLDLLTEWQAGSLSLQEALDQLRSQVPAEVACSSVALDRIDLALHQVPLHSSEEAGKQSTMAS